MLRIATTLIISLMLSACTGTSIVQDWQDDMVDNKYRHIFIVAISDSQQNRRIFENLLVEDLRELGIKATPSFEQISSKITIDKESVTAAIRGTDVDAVLVSYLVANDSEIRVHDSPVGQTYSGSADTNMMSATLIGTRGRYDIDETVELRHDLFDVSKRELVWSIQTRTKGPESIDDLIVEVTDIVRDQLDSDGKIAGN